MGGHLTGLTQDIGADGILFGLDAEFAGGFVFRLCSGQFGRQLGIEFPDGLMMGLAVALTPLEPQGSHGVGIPVLAIAEGVLAHQADIDERIRQTASNYDLHRIAAVDRNILRMAIFEMLFCPEVPPVVSINEAIEIAKRFGSDESGRFVNGILDRIRGGLPRPARAAKPE